MNPKFRKAILSAAAAVCLATVSGTAMARDYGHRGHQGCESHKEVHHHYYYSQRQQQPNNYYGRGYVCGYQAPARHAGYAAAPRTYGSSSYYSPYRSRQQPNFGNAVGGALGGFVGSKIGKGSGQLAATAAGTIMGYMLGGHVQPGYR